MYYILFTFVPYYTNPTEIDPKRIEFFVNTYYIIM